jgi:hypothetical protein
MVSVPEPADDLKLKELLLLQREVSAYILWVDGPKMQQDGFRWAPLTFLANRDQDMVERLRNRHPAYVTEVGLSVKLLGLEVRTPFLLDAKDFLLLDEATGLEYIITMQPDAPDDVDLAKISDPSIIVLDPSKAGGG